MVIDCRTGVEAELNGAGAAGVLFVLGV